MLICCAVYSPWSKLYKKFGATYVYGMNGYMTFKLYVASYQWKINVFIMQYVIRKDDPCGNTRMFKFEQLLNIFQMELLEISKQSLEEYLKSWFK